MRKLLTWSLCILFGVSQIPHILFAVDAAATSGKIHHFAIIAPPTAKVGEAIDVTVEARDKDGKVVTDYRGSVFFSCDTDFGASLPAQGRAIQFQESYNGVLKTVKGTTFKRVGKQELTVSAALEDVGGSITIMVEDAAGSTPTGSDTNESVIINFPEKGTTVTTDNIMMSGKTKKNSKITVSLNGKELGSSQTDENGIFTYKVSDISQQVNLLRVSVYDGSDTVIGAAETSFNYGGRLPAYFNTSIQPGLQVDGGGTIIMTIDAEPSLGTVTALLDGTILTAVEGSPGKYTINTVAPSRAGVYPITVVLKNIIGQTLEKKDAAILSVKPDVAPAPLPVNSGSVNSGSTQENTGSSLAKPRFQNVLVTTEGSRVNLNFSVENLPLDTTKFKIAYGENAESLSSEVTTFALDKIRRPNGTYNWYIDNLPQKSYVFKIFGLKADGSLVTDFVSEPQTIIVGKQGACSIGNIPAITSTAYPDKTILTWPSLTGAISYNVYRINASRGLELIENVKSNTYTIFFSPGTVSYSDFAVKAVCDKGAESEVPAIASRVQTGPGAIAALVILAALGSVLLLRRKMI